MAHFVKCIYCHENFDRDKNDFIKVGERRYAHTKCHEANESFKSQQEKDKEQLEAYILNLFHEEVINPKIKKQINDLIQADYTYSGILRTLTYFYDVQKHDLSKANGGIGIVSYVYADAQKYYYSLWETNQINSEKNIEEYKPKEIEVIILPPKRQIQKRSKFVFLDNDEVNSYGEQ